MDTVSRKELAQIERRLNDENARQNHRLSALEETVNQIHDLTVSVKELAISVKGIAESQSTYNRRLETLENKDGEKWRALVSHAVTALVTAAVTFALSKLGLT